MPRYIDAEALAGEMDAGCIPIVEKGISGVTGDETCIMDYINNAPTVDMLEVDAKRIAKLEAQVPKWISVNDRLPEPGITKLIVTVRNEHGNIVDMARYLGPQEGWDLVSWKLWDKNVTHWMPLPEPPKDESEVEDDA